MLIAGAGVAGLETLLALRALAGDRIDVTLLAPELKFVNSSMSVAQPFIPRVRGVRIEDIAIELGARWAGVLRTVSSTLAGARSRAMATGLLTRCSFSLLGHARAGMEFNGRSDIS